MTKPIEFDVETTGLQPYSGKHEAFLYCFYDGKDAVALPYSSDDKSNHEEIQRWFDRSNDTGIRAWNTKFDRAFADQAGFNTPADGKWHDGMIVAHAVDERRSVALKAVASQLFGEEAADLQKQVKAWLTQERRDRKKAADADNTQLIEPNYSDVPMDLMEPYALEDVLLTRRVSDHYDAILAQDPGIQKVVDFEREVLDALYAVEQRGMPARGEWYHKLQQEVVDNLEALEDRVIQLAGDPDFNPNSTPQIIEALKRRGADMRFMSTKDGKISADADNLRAVDDELAAAILEFRSEYKVLSTYVKPMIHPHWEASMRMEKQPFIATGWSHPRELPSGWRAHRAYVLLGPEHAEPAPRRPTPALQHHGRRWHGASRVRPLEHRNGPVRGLRRRGQATRRGTPWRRLAPAHREDARTP